MLDLARLSFVNSWQRGFPLTARPFAQIAIQCGRDEDQVLEEFLELKTHGVIDRIGPVFRPNTVGASLLAAMAVPRERLGAVAELVSGQAGVNHNYEREHRYNLWFVVTGATEAQVRATLARIEEAARLEALRLPLLEEFHIDLGFDLDTRAAPRASRRGPFPELSVQEKKLVPAVAAGLPLVRAPYEALALELGTSEAEVLRLLAGMLADGRIRRIGAVIRHRRVGYDANAMVVWDVPDVQASEIGQRLAADAAISLCYRRARALPAWPYNLYCMVHGRSRARVLYEVKRMSALHGLAPFARSVLFSRRCFAQRAARYG
jgi:DNA-binding Lrp family transcriptional regulator